MAKIKEDAENSGKSSDPWEVNESNENDDDENSDNEEKSSEDHRTGSEHSQVHDERFHAAFHAKKQSRLDQRRRITQKPIHEAHTEL